MSKLITKKVFITIFKKKEYRDKLDKIILNFFGLDANKKIIGSSIKKERNFLKFVLMINTEIVLNILVEDTKKLFQNPKTFYVNISLREVEKYHELLIPCYWEIYAPFSYKNLKENPKLILFSALLCCETKKEIKSILEKLVIFSDKDIREILKIILNL